ncbi:unnamed protein product [Pleuronectes platessa]|uniref:Uncharacterized protein n=1 Tax=Pleuronectes platessa TaxID=8262 RepID=A0A9N7YA84_PLEPL|nr:unnamed protein product [Pleuronectes platessa]
MGERRWWERGGGWEERGEEEVGGAAWSRARRIRQRRDCSETGLLQLMEPVNRLHLLLSGQERRHKHSELHRKTYAHFMSPGRGPINKHLLELLESLCTGGSSPTGWHTLKSLMRLMQEEMVLAWRPAERGETPSSAAPTLVNILHCDKRACELESTLVDLGVGRNHDFLSVNTPPFDSPVTLMHCLIQQVSRLGVGSNTRLNFCRRRRRQRKSQRRLHYLNLFAYVGDHRHSQSPEASSRTLSTECNYSAVWSGCVFYYQALKRLMLFSPNGEGQRAMETERECERRRGGQSHTPRQQTKAEREGEREGEDVEWRRERARGAGRGGGGGGGGGGQWKLMSCSRSDERK